MGQVYGRMSIPGAVGIYSARWSAGDHQESCPSKAKPSLRGANKSTSSPSTARRRRRSMSVDSGYSNNGRFGMRITRQAARQLAIERAAQQAASVRRSPRLARAYGGSRSNRSSNASASVGMATLPTTLRRSARIAGFRYIGHRMAADFGSSPAARLRRCVATGATNPTSRPTSSAPVAPSSAPFEARRSARLMRV